MSSTRRGEASRAHHGDERALRGTRLRLALWSAAITLIVLVLLGSALYVVVARQLAADSEAQLRARAAAMASDPLLFGPDAIPMPVPAVLADSAEMPGLLFGGPLSGTVALIVDPAVAGTPAAMTTDPSADPSEMPGPLGFMGTPEMLAGIIDFTTVDTIEAEEERITLTQIGGTPVRVLSAPVETARGSLGLRVLSDRSAELRTLESLLLVLLVAIPLAAAAAGLAGWAYSGRALVPIRGAIERQRRFAADASHELRTPLTVVSGNLQALAGADHAITRDDEAITDSIAEADRMAALLDDLLLLARTDAEALVLDIASMDLADEATEAVEGLASQARDRSIEVVLDMEPSPMRGDAGRLRQLMLILVDNAIRYSSTHGHIWITIRPTGRTVTLVVADDGPGIASADRELVFERFWRGRDVTRAGHGLGLAIARWIVTAHEGQIVVDERPGGGARFTVSLPDRA